MPFRCKIRMGASGSGAVSLTNGRAVGTKRGSVEFLEQRHPTRVTEETRHKTRTKTHLATAGSRAEVEIIADSCRPVTSLSQTALGSKGRSRTHGHRGLITSALGNLARRIHRLLILWGRESLLSIIVRARGGLPKKGIFTFELVDHRIGGQERREV